MPNEIATVDQRQHLPAAMSEVESVKRRLDMIRDLMRQTMEQGVDYGVVPGTNSKPTLLKPGAEKLCVMFQLAERFDTEKTWLAGDHLMVESKCRIHDLQDRFLGEASALCSTKESKYAYRKAERVCPACGKPAVIKGQAKYGGGYVCWKRKDGCGTTFADDDPAITSQVTGRVPNPDLPDIYNTVVRIAEKRAMIGAVRMITGASSLFDEEIPDREDAGGDDGDIRPEPARPAAKHPQEPADMDRWQEMLKNPVTAEYLNAQLEAWSKLPDGNNRKAVGKLISDRAKSDGFAFDKGKGCYVPKVDHVRISGEQCIDLAGLLDRAGYACDAFLADYQIKALGELPVVHWAAAKGMLEGMIANRQSKKAGAPA